MVKEDIEHILKHTEHLWEDLRHAKVLLTGGTGFFGKWVLSSFLAANEKYNLNAKITVVSRNPEKFKREFPEFQDIHFHKGYYWNQCKRVTHIIHAASTSAEETFNGETALGKYATITELTRHVLNLAADNNAKVLYVSSGVASQNINHLDPKNALAISKRTAESLCGMYVDEFGLDIKIARPFTFVGPEMQLDVHYAIGNFIRDALNGGPIVITGDRPAVRSYMYISDLVIWLWHILLRGKTMVPYDVGSPHFISVDVLAHMIGSMYGCDIEYLNKPTGKPTDYYLPYDVVETIEGLGVAVRVELEEAIYKTYEYYRRKRG